MIARGKWPQGTDGLYAAPHCLTFPWKAHPSASLFLAALHYTILTLPPSPLPKQHTYPLSTMETNFWKDVCEWHDTADHIANEPPAPVIRCPICLEHVAVRCIPWDPNNSEAATSQGAVFYICGHILCFRCYATIRTDPGSGESRCPVCRYKLHFTDCRCVMLPCYVPSPTGQHVRFEEFWQTLDQGATHPNRCNECAVKHYTDTVKAATARLGVRNSSWTRLIREKGGERAIQGLTADEVDAIETLHRMWLGHQNGWSSDAAIPNVPEYGVV